MRVTIDRQRRRLTTALLAGSAALIMSACSSETSDGAATGSAGQPSGEASSAVQEAQANVKDHYAGANYGEPPSEGPVALKGARVAMINTGVQAPTGSLVAENAQEIADIMGWELSVYDGKFDPNGYQEGIRQAISAKADVIWLFAIDCPLVRNALEEAKAANIPILAQEAADCSDVDPSAPSLFTQNLQYAEGSFIEWGQALGAAQADWLIAEADGEAKVIEVWVPDLVVTQALHEGFVERMKSCSTCEIVQSVESSAATLGPELQAKIEQAILRNPTANGLAVSYDDLMTSGGAAAVQGSGRSADLAVIAGTGFPANIELIREDKGQDAGFGIDYGYETWAAADMINRFLSDAPVEPSGVSLGLYDRDNALPDSGEGYSSGVDYRTAYTEVWQG